MAKIDKTLWSRDFTCMVERAKFLGEKKDCGVKALALATGCTYDVALDALARTGRKPGKGTHMHQMEDALLGLGFKRWTRSTGAVVKKLAGERDYHVKNLTTRQIDMFPGILGDGVYIVASKSHVACVRDGVVHDWSMARALRIVTLWEIVRH